MGLVYWRCPTLRLAAVCDAPRPSSNPKREKGRKEKRTPFRARSKWRKKVSDIPDNPEFLFSLFSLFPHTVSSAESAETRRSAFLPFFSLFSPFLPFPLSPRRSNTRSGDRGSVEIAGGEREKEKGERKGGKAGMGLVYWRCPTLRLTSVCDAHRPSSKPKRGKRGKGKRPSFRARSNWRKKSFRHSRQPRISLPPFPPFSTYCVQCRKRRNQQN
jgi:hypothetical protein